MGMLSDLNPFLVLEKIKKNLKLIKKNSQLCLMLKVLDNLLSILIVSLLKALKEELAG